MDTKFFIRETAFDALIDSAHISAQQKLYLLYQHLDGKAKKVVEQLQYMVGANPEIAYNEARKKLKQRFGRSGIVATDFEKKLSNWPKIANSDAQGLRDFSDFLQQVEIAKTHLPSLKIFEYPSKLQTLVEKLPSWFLTKWSIKVQTLQQEKGCDAFPSLSEFVDQVTFHADRMNIPQIFHHGQTVTNSTSTSSQPRRKLPGSTTMTTKTGNANQTPFPESKKETSAKKSTENSSVVKKLCLFHKTKTHTLNECQKFRELSLDDRREFFKKNKLCFKCMASDKHFAENCDQNPPQCDICQKKHLQDIEHEYGPIKVPFAYTREFIPASHEDIATPHVASQWKHLSKIADNIHDRADVDIGLLVG